MFFAGGVFTKLLIIGATGMLGKALVREALNRNIDVIGASRQGSDYSLDLLSDGEVLNAVNLIGPDIIINAAASTNLLECEKNPGNAYLVNARSVGLLAQIAKNKGIYFIHISTDHYYTGEYNRKHTELSPVCLLNEYARTKYAGEVFALTCPGAFIVRTNIVGFRGKPSVPTFAEWVLQTVKAGSPITLFNDFYTSSIDVRQFSAALFDIMKNRPSGIINLASREVANKKQFIECIAKKLGYSIEHASVGSVNSIPGVVRAESLGLDVSRAESILQYSLPTMEEVVNSLVTEYKEGIYSGI